MRVLFIYKDYYPVLGGIEGHLRLLAEGLAARGIDVRVLVTNTGRNTVEEKLNGVTITKFGRVGNISSAPLSADLVRSIHRFDADIAHLHSPYAVGELAMLWRGRARHMVVTYHSDIIRQRLLGWAYSPFLRRLLAQADAISLSNPSYMRSSPFVSAQKAKCIVIHHGQDLSRFEPTPRSQALAQQIRSEHGESIVLFVGKLRYYKGVDVLLAALREVRGGARALIAGTGPMETEWRALARSLGLEDRARFLGKVADEELPAYYQAAQLFVLPSTQPSETWGAVQIEAMASGVPCISTELGTGTSYVNQHGVTGLVVAPRDPPALARAINRLLENKEERTNMGMAALARARAEFGHHEMVERTLQLYERLLTGGIA